MLSKKEIICPENLLNLAKTKGPAKAVIVNAVKPVSIESAKQAVDANLIIPVFIGDKSIIEKNAKQLNWNISKYEIIKLIGNESFTRYKNYHQNLSKNNSSFLQKRLFILRTNLWDYDVVYNQCKVLDFSLSVLDE
mgnify:CR=1 FL=1